MGLISRPSAAMARLTCLECGAEFDWPKHKKTCSQTCWKMRRQRQWLAADENRSDESRASGRIQRASPQAREKHAARERAARASGARPKPLRDETQEQAAARRAYARNWWQSSDAASAERMRRNEKKRALRNTPAGDALRERGRLDARNRRAKIALLQTTRITDDPDRNE